MSAPLPVERTDAGREPRGHAGPVQVLLADVEGIARGAVASLLADLDGVELVGETGDHDGLAATLRRVHPDVLILDDRLVRAGDHVLAGLGPQRGHVRVIVIGVDDDPAFAARARRLGADAWMAKDRADEELPALLRAR